jgi:hypothetical protein
MLSRYSGIVGLIQLGDTEQAILSRVKWTNKRAELPKSHGLAKMRFSHMMYFPDGGVRAYFRNDKVALIEVQNPFSGEVQGTRLSVFKLTSTQQSEKWDEVIQNEFGPPTARTDRAMVPLIPRRFSTLGEMFPSTPAA